MNMTAWAKPLDMPIKAPKMATAMMATSKTVIPSCSIAPYTLRDLLALAPTRPFERAVGRLKARHKHGQHHGEPVGIPADHGMARRGEGGGRHQRLDLDQDRPRALDAGEHAGARDMAAPLAEEQRRRVGDVGEAAIGHLEHADLV